MNRKVGSVRNIKTINALRGDKLTIDLGKEFTGGVLTAWMRKDANSVTFRSFEIVGNRYLVLPQEKTKDYYNDENELVEAIAGKWYFDVEFLKDGDDATLSKTIYQGTINYVNDITGSPGYEITGDGTRFPEYTLTELANDEFSLLKNGDIVSTISLSEYAKVVDLFSGDYNDLTNAPNTNSTLDWTVDQGAIEINPLNYENTQRSDAEIQAIIDANSAGFVDEYSVIGATDTPSSYSGQAANILRVNGAEDALEFYDINEVTGKLNEQVTVLENTVNNIPTHANIDVLDKFGEDVNGLPTYNGNAVDTTIAQRDVYDGLDSTDNTISLAASQGKVLKDTQNTQQTEINLNTAKVSNVKADWDATSGEAEILNKPEIPSNESITESIQGNYPIEFPEASCYNLTLIGNTTLLNDTTPSLGFTKTLTIYVIGDFSLTLPVEWDIKNGGVYDGVNGSQIVVQYRGNGEYYTVINNEQ